MKHFFLLSLILISTIVVFFPTINTYFSQDDWVFLSHVYKRPWIDVFRYYPEAFYRPIGQQLFFKIGSVLSGLNPVRYHVTGLLIHSINTWLLWKLISSHSGASRRAIESTTQLLLVIFYVLHPVHLIALNWLTQVDIEIAALFSLLTMLLFERHFFISVLTFSAALLSHETAAMLPVVLWISKVLALRSQGQDLGVLKGLTPTWRGQTLRNRWLSLFFITFIVLLAKYLANPFPFQSDYSLGIHPLSMFSTVKWYILRAFYLPEGIRQLPLLVQLFSIFAAIFLVAVFRWNLVKALFVFLISLLPVLFLSQHVFSVYAVIPVLLMTIALAKSFSGDHIGTMKAVLVMTLLFVTSFSISRAVIPAHWTTTRGEISRKLTDEFLKRPGPADAGPGLTTFPTDSEPSFASMTGRQFEVLRR